MVYDPDTIRASKLRKEVSLNSSGKLSRLGKIPILREQNYFVEEIALDGDAPKQFIKAYIYSPQSGIRRKNPNTWIPYIAKSAQKWYPHESVVEYLINRVGQVLGLKMNEIGLYRINGQVRFLSRYFIEREEEQLLVHGAEVGGMYLNDKSFAEEVANSRKTAREFFTFQFIEKAMLAVFPSHGESLLRELVKMIIYDGIAGNNDRHFYNWAIITSVHKNGPAPQMAPVYDSARGLFWNYSEHDICRHYRNYCQDPGYTKIEKYIDNACPRISLEGDEKANHFKLIAYLKRYKSDYCDLVEQLSSEENEQKVTQMYREEFAHLFSKERNELILLILKKRFERIRNLE